MVQPPLALLIDETTKHLRKALVLRRKALRLDDYLCLLRSNLPRLHALTEHRVDLVELEDKLQQLLDSSRRIQSLDGPGGVLVSFVLSRLEVGRLDELHQDLVLLTEPGLGLGGLGPTDIEETLRELDSQQQADNCDDLDADVGLFREHLRLLKNDPVMRAAAMEVEGSIAGLESSKVAERVLSARTIRRSLDTLAARAFEAIDDELANIAPEDLEVFEDQIIGRGPCGPVVRGRWGGQPVTAICIFTPPESLVEQDALRKLVERWRRLKCPYLLSVHGTCVTRRGLVVVCEHGDLSLDALLQHPESGGLESEETDTIIRNLAKALAFLHSHAILHRHVRPRNVWLSSDLGSAKLSLWPLDRHVPTNQLAVYRPPECDAEPACWTSRGDMYSFGIICWELLHGERAHRLPVRPSFRGAPDLTKPWERRLVEQCLDRDPRLRPFSPDVMRVMQSNAPRRRSSGVIRDIVGSVIKTGRNSLPRMLTPRREMQSWIPGQGAVAQRRSLQRFSLQRRAAEPKPAEEEKDGEEEVTTTTAPTKKKKPAQKKKVVQKKKPAQKPAATAGKKKKKSRVPRALQPAEERVEEKRPQSAQPAAQPAVLSTDGDSRSDFAAPGRGTRPPMPPRPRGRDPTPLMAAIADLREGAESEAVLLERIASLLCEHKQKYTLASPSDDLLWAVRGCLDNVDAQRWGLVVLRCLAIGNAANQETLLEANMHHHILLAMRTHAKSPRVQANGCVALYTMLMTSQGTIATDHQELLVRAGACNDVTQAIRGHRTNHRVVVNACWALIGLSNGNSAVQTNLVRLGAPALLLRAIKTHLGDANVLENACGALWNLTERNSAVQKTVAGLDAVPIILTAMRTHLLDSRVQENALGTLRALVQGNPSRRLSFAKLGLAEHVTSVLQAHASDQDLQLLVFSLANALATEDPEVQRVMVKKGMLRQVQSARANVADNPRLAAAISRLSVLLSESAL